MTGSEAADRAVVGPTYDAFISYSHAADDLLAPRLQTGLQVFAKPWWKRRALRVFRDQSSLSANPALWSSITDALDRSAWFIVLLSPLAASSEWVNREVEYWVEHKDPNRLLPVVTEGEFRWDEAESRFSASTSALPPALHGAFHEEPRWVDMRWAREDTQLDLRNSRFRAGVADISSAVRGVPKDDLESEEVRQHRRTVRTAWAAGLALALLAAASAGAAVYANGQRQEANAERTNAETQADRALDAEGQARSRELAASATNVIDDDPELSILLALEALDKLPEDGAVPVETQLALRQAAGASLIIRREELGNTDFGYEIAISPDGSRLAVAGQVDGLISAINVDTWTPLWESKTGSTGPSKNLAYSPDGATIAVSTMENESPSRVDFLDAETGDIRGSVTFDACQYAEIQPRGYSPDGRWLAVSVATDWCELEPQDWLVYLVETGSHEVSHILPAPPYPLVSWSNDGLRFAVSSYKNASTAIYESQSMAVASEVPVRNAALSPLGNILAGFEFDATVLLADVASGAIIDRLPGNDYGADLLWTHDGTQLVVGSVGEPWAIVWDVPSGTQINRLATPGNVQSMAVDRLGILFYANNAGSLSVWDLSGSRIGELSSVNFDSFVFPNSFLTSQSIGTFTADGETWTFDPGSGALTGSTGLEAHTQGVPISDGRIVAQLSSVDQDRVGPVVVLDPVSGVTKVLAGCWVIFPTFPEEMPPCLDGEGSFGRVTGLFVAPDAASLLVVMGDGRSTVFDLPSLTKTGTYQLGLVDELGFTEFLVVGYGGAWVVADQFGAFNILDLASGEALTADFTAECLWYSWEVSRDGRQLAAATDCGEVLILDAEDWAVVSRFQAHNNARIDGLAFSPDGSHLMTAGSDGLVRVSETSNGEPTALIPLPDVADGYWLDDSHIVIGTAEGLWTTLTLDISELEALARSRLARDFTPQECAAYRIDRCS